jgi:hypothetical protein
MIWPFQKLDQLLDLIETKPWRRLQVPRFHFERLPSRILGSGQSQPQAPVHHLLEGFASLAGLFLQQASHIVIERKSSSHITMLLI